MHAGLVVIFGLFFDCHVERCQIEKLLITQSGIDPCVNHFYLILYQCFVFWFAGTGRNYSYGPGQCPVAEALIPEQLGLPINEFFTEKDIEETAAAIRKVAEAYLK